MLGDKGAEARRLRKIAHDAEDKAYSEGEKYNLFTGVFSKFDNAINTGYAKAKNNAHKKISIQATINASKKLSNINNTKKGTKIQEIFTLLEYL